MKQQSQQLTRQVRKHTNSVPRALAALDKMESQLDSVRTYEALRKIQREAEALGILLENVREVRERSQLVLALTRRRIAEEMQKIKKATVSGKGQKKTGSRKPAKSGGRGATGVKKDSRARMAKLLGITKENLREIITELHAEGKDATENAILAVLKDRDIKRQRRTFEARRDKGARVEDLIAMAERGEKFKVIYADPPWEFKVYSGKGKQRSAERHYDTASLSAIKALPIAPLADDDCLLMLWGVCPELPGALDVIKAWGFEYKTVGFLWVKTTPAAEQVALDGDGLHWGMGYWTRANVEPVLLATKGNPTRMAMDVHQVIVAPVGDHSEKPEEARRRIEQLVVGPYLELFGRKPHPGWTVWGNEIEAEQREAAE